ncbi:glycine--tRNA ligase [Patescibacteria group bacterium]|nr:glycine--tRNA ligase [Patescibacteria group bacterium]
MEKIVSLCKRRGFIFPSSEIYGGLAACYDYGPLGVELKNNIKKAWWKKVVQEREDVSGLDASILMNSKVWEASGHLSGFVDPLVECKSCHKRFKLDDLRGKHKCPECEGALTEAKNFNLLFKTFMGPVEDKSSVVYLRPETAQGIFVNFNNILQSSRVKIPFGIAQIGKTFRNEITLGNFIFRTREFEQMELEFFVKPAEAKKWYKFWLEQRLNWYLDLGIKKKSIRLREHKKDELAHYAKSCSDVEYKFPFGWSELEGIADRGDFDLTQHQKYSGQDMSYQDEKGKKFIPYVIEPSAGVDRPLLAFLVDAYEEIKGGRTTTTQSVKEQEIVLRLHKDLAPIKVAVLPLTKKTPLIKMAQDIYKDLKKHWMTQYDEVGSIGRRYRRQDEIGTILAVTVDFESLKQKDVTVRNRDTMRQERIAIDTLVNYLKKQLDS